VLDAIRCGVREPVTWPTPDGIRQRLQVDVANAPKPGERSASMLWVAAILTGIR